MQESKGYVPRGNRRENIKKAPQEEASKETPTKKEIEYYFSLPTGVRPYPENPPAEFLRLVELGWIEELPEIRSFKEKRPRSFRTVKTGMSPLRYQVGAQQDFLSSHTKLYEKHKSPTLAEEIRNQTAGLVVTEAAELTQSDPLESGPVLAGLNQYQSDLYRWLVAHNPVGEPIGVKKMTIPDVVKRHTLPRTFKTLTEKGYATYLGYDRTDDKEGRGDAIYILTGLSNAPSTKSAPPEQISPKSNENRS